MTEWTYDSQQGRGELKVACDLTITHVAVLKDALLKAFAEADQIVVDIGVVTECDVAGLQVLYAGHRFAVEHNKQMSLIVKANPVFVQLVEEAGFARSLFCGTGQEYACLWSVASERNNPS